jgi:hypothetical protein
MEEAKNIGDGLKHTFLELEKHAVDANEKLRIYLNGLSRKDMKDKIIKLNLSDKSLNFLCEGIALEHEDYEICIAVEEIKKERALNKSTVPV